MVRVRSGDGDLGYVTFVKAVFPRRVCGAFWEKPILPAVAAVGLANVPHFRNRSVNASKVMRCDESQCL